MSKKKKTGVGEWAENSFNFQNGCRNGCKYCYARKIKRQYEPHIDFDNPVLHLTKSAAGMLQDKVNGRIMFPTMHDIDEDNARAAKSYLIRLLELGNNVLWVTKGGTAVEWIIEEIQSELNRDELNRLEVRITMGSMNIDTLARWEPNAPCFSDRETLLFMLDTLGMKSSISCEPMLDDTVYNLTKYLPHLTGGIWYGFMNNHPEKPVLNDPLTKLLQLKEQYGDAIHFKDSVVKALEKKS